MTKTPGLPNNLDSERFILASIWIDGNHYREASEMLPIEAFSIEKHRRIYRRMGDLDARGEHIDRGTLANELHRLGELDSVDGLSYLMEMENGVPFNISISSHLRIIRDSFVHRSFMLSMQHGIDQASLNGTTPQELIESAEQKLNILKGHLNRGKKATRAFPDEIVEEGGGLSKFLYPVHRTGIPTGFPKLDRYIYGLQKGKTILVGGRTSMGKSVLCGSIADSIASRGIPGLYISAEMDKASLLRRSAARLAQVSLGRMNRCECGDDERKRLTFAMNQVLSWPLAIDDRGPMTIMGIHNKIDHGIREDKIQFVIVDYLQRLSWQSDRDFDFKGSSYHAMSTYSTKFKDFAKDDFNIPIIVVSQMNRPIGGVRGKDKDLRPKLGDFRDSGRIEEDADVVLSVYREERDKGDSPEYRGRAEVTVLKQRDGPVGTIQMKFRGYCVRLEEDPDSVSGEDGE
jgi:replicative DNA helicase